MSRNKVLIKLIIFTSITAILGCGSQQSNIQNVSIDASKLIPPNSSESTAKVSSISASSQNVSIGIGETKPLLASVKYTDGSGNNSVFWESSDSSIATINQEGLLTAKKEGTVKITVSAKKDVDKKTTINVTVSKSVSTDLSPSSNVNISEQVTLNNEEVNSTLVPEMVLVEGGTFNMGDKSDPSEIYDGKGAYYNKIPTHKVTVSSFYIGKYEITQKEYSSLGGGNNAIRKGDNKPAELISYYNAIKYCNRLSKKNNLPIAYDEKTGNFLDSSGNETIDPTKVKGYRLPTEAEWEFAARGGNKSTNSLFSGSNDVNKVSWHSGNSGFITQSVGLKSPNELGLYDMSGNVWEICSDVFETSYSDLSPKINPYYWIGSSRVIRGGSSQESKDHSSVFFRTSTDSYLGALSSTTQDTGFRIAKTAN